MELKRDSLYLLRTTLQEQIGVIIDEISGFTYNITDEILSVVWEVPNHFIPWHIQNTLSGKQVGT